MIRVASVFSSLTNAALCIAVAISVLVLAPCTSSAKGGNVRWPDLPALRDDSVDSNTIVAAYFLVPVGVRFAFVRLRWEVFQFEWGSFGFVGNTVGRKLAVIHVWALGVGVKRHFGAERRHEIGFLAYPLGASLYWGPRDAGFGEAETDPAHWKLIRDPDATSYLPTTAYYRYNIGFTHVEAGLIVPLIFNWKNRLYAYFPPVELYVGGGF